MHTLRPTKMELSERDYEMIISALTRRQHAFIVGDKQYKEYEKLADKFKQLSGIES